MGNAVGALSPQGATMKHGHNGYKVHGCRCEVCSRAARCYNRRRAAALRDLARQTTVLQARDGQSANRKVHGRSPCAGAPCQTPASSARGPRSRSGGRKNAKTTPAGA